MWTLYPRKRLNRRQSSGLVIRELAEGLVRALEIAVPSDARQIKRAVQAIQENVTNSNVMEQQSFDELSSLAVLSKAIPVNLELDQVSVSAWDVGNGEVVHGVALRHEGPSRTTTSVILDLGHVAGFDQFALVLLRQWDGVDEPLACDRPAHEWRFMDESAAAKVSAVLARADDLGWEKSVDRASTYVPTQFDEWQISNCK